MKPDPENKVESAERGPTIAAEQRIRQIVDEAAKLFDKVGYHTANMEMVAKATNLRKPTLYHYIKSKEEILLRVHQTLIDDLGAKHQARLELGLDREQLILGIITDILRAIADNRGYVRVLLEHYRELDPAMRQQISGKRRAYFKCMTDLIRDGVAEGVYFTDNVEMSALFLLGQANWAYQWYAPGTSPAPEAIAHAMLDTFLYGLTQPRRAEPASAEPSPSSAKTVVSPKAAPAATKAAVAAKAAPAAPKAVATVTKAKPAPKKAAVSRTKAKPASAK